MARSFGNRAAWFGTQCKLAFAYIISILADGS
jgi:hypothetical protein